MMTQQLRASILSAPLAAIDRRALSQAWYSALNLARRGSPNAASPAAAHATTPSPAAMGTIRGVAVPEFRSAISSTTRVAPARTSGKRAAGEGGMGVDRRAPRSALARNIERAFLHPRRPPERSTFAVGDGAARVHVVLQGKDGRLALVAICTPAQKAAVARALAHARFALASRGIPLDVEATTGRPSCS
jgi:hypothetical protein